MIRYFKANDKDRLADALLNDPDARSFMNIVGASEHDMFKENSDRWSAKFVCEKSGKPVAFLAITFYIERREARINELYVIKDYRGQHIGSELLDFAEGFIKQNWPETKIITSFTLEGSNAALYKAKRGFTLMGTYKKFVRGLDQHYWVKEIR